MNALKIIGSIIIILMIAIVMLGLTLPTEVTLNRSVTIHAPVSEVFERVNDLRAWVEWSPWAKLDSGQDIDDADFHGTLPGVGQRYCWDLPREQVGAGCMEIIESQPGEHLVTKLDFGEMGTGNGEWTFVKKRENLTEVHWTMHADMSRPAIIGPIMGILMDGFVGDLFESGLQNLKHLSETPKHFELSTATNHR